MSSRNTLYENMAMLNKAQSAQDIVFPNPYLDFTSSRLPSSHINVFRLIEYLWVAYNDFSRAVDNIVRYFITDFDISDVETAEAEQWRDFLNNILKAKQLLGLVGTDWFLYGLSLSTVKIPFRRFLICGNPKCRLRQPIECVQYRFKNYEFFARCPRCGYSGKFDRKDMRTYDANDISVYRVSPKDLDIAFDLFSGKTEYRWRIPPDYVESIKRGVPIVINNVPWEIVETVKANGTLRLDPELSYCFRSHVPAGLVSETAGWGLPPVFGCLKQFWYVQVLRRANEAVGMDYIVPIRMMFPSSGPEGGPLASIGGANFAARLKSVIETHRANPTDIHVVPFPVEYKAFGAEGQAVAPIEMLDKGMDSFLHSLGLPAELYRMNFQIQTMPASLRWFEQVWQDLVVGLNDWLNWICGVTSRLLNWEPPQVKLQPVSLADNVELQQLRLRLAAAGATSWDTALKPFNLSYKEEVVKRMQEQAWQQRMLEEFAREQQQRAETQAKFDSMLSGQMMPGGQMPATTGQSPTALAQAPAGATGTASQDNSLEGKLYQAQQIAQQLAGMDETTRRQELRQLKRTDEALHSLVIAAWEKLQRNAELIGKRQVLQQASSGY